MTPVEAAGAPRAAPSPGRVTVAIVVTSVLFGANLVALKVGLRHAGPFTLQAWALLSAALFLAAPSLRRGRPTLDRTQVLGAVPIALALTVGTAVGTVLGVQRVSAGVAALVMALSPVVTLLLTRLVAKQRVGVAQVAGIALGVAGVAAVTLLTEEGTTAQLVGVAWLLLAAVSWAVGLLLTKRITVGTPPLAFVALQLGLGVPIMFALAWVAEDLAVAWRTEYVVAVLFSGALSKGLGSLLQYLTTGWTSPVQSSLTAFLVPLVAVGLAAVFVDEPVLPAHLLGAALVAVGVALVRRSPEG